LRAVVAKGKSEKNARAGVASDGDCAVALRWHRRHFHEPPAGGRLCY
jgi:hypothetical protein